MIEAEMILQLGETLRDCSEKEKALIANAKPIGAAMASAIGAFRDALTAGGYASDDALLKTFGEEIVTLAIGLWVQNTPSLAPLLTKARAAAVARAESLLAEIRRGEWKAASSPIRSAAAGSERTQPKFSEANQHPKTTPMTTTSPASRPTITAESIVSALNAFAAEKDPRKRGAIYAKDISPRMDEAEMVPISAANAPGSLAGTLVTQRTLELLKFQFPVLKQISTDFTAESALYNQTIKSRVVAIPTVSTYNTTTGYAQTDMTSVDVDVTLNQHKYVQITFDANTLSGTVRQLFDDFAPASSYALAKDMVDAVYALITAANFTATPTTKSLVNFARNDVIDMGTALTLRGVPGGSLNRSLLLHPTYYGQVEKDSGTVLNAVTALAAFQRPEILTEGVLPNLDGFKVINAPNLPGNSENLVGFGMSRSALLVATRLPSDYANVLPGASNGIVTPVIDPDLGIAVMQVQYVDHTLGRANQRMALIYGVAKGQDNAGQRLVSA
jgi:hypothetical protein